MSSRGIVAWALVGLASSLASGQGGWGGSPDTPPAPPPEVAGEIAREAQATGAPSWARTGVALLYTATNSSEDMQGSVQAGGGYTRFELVGFDGDRALFHTSVYVPAGAGAGYVLSGAPSVVLGPEEVSIGDGLWKPIADLQSMKPLGDDNAAHQILIEKWPVGNRSVDAVIEISRDRDSIRRLVFDRDQGIKLSEAQASGPMRRHGGENLGFNRKHQTLVRFDSMEMFNPPWAGGQTPPWAKSVRTLSYRGSIAMQVGDFPPIPMPLTHEFTISERGDGWVIGTAKYRSESPGQPAQDSSTLFVQGPGSRSAYWYDPQKLRNTRSGVAHRDQKLGITLRYDTDGRFGIVTESCSAGAYRAQWFYSLDDGAMVRFAIQQRDTGVVTTLDLVGRN